VMVPTQVQQNFSNGWEPLKNGSDSGGARRLNRATERFHRYAPLRQARLRRCAKPACDRSRSMGVGDPI
jgi:hypothetical protein